MARTFIFLMADNQEKNGNDENAILAGELEEGVVLSEDDENKSEKFQKELSLQRRIYDECFSEIWKDKYDSEHTEAVRSLHGLDDLFQEKINGYDLNEFILDSVDVDPSMSATEKVEIFYTKLAENAQCISNLFKVVEDSLESEDWHPANLMSEFEKSEDWQKLTRYQKINFHRRIFDLYRKQKMLEKYLQEKTPKELACLFRHVDPSEIKGRIELEIKNGVPIFWVENQDDYVALHKREGGEESEGFAHEYKDVTSRLKDIPTDFIFMNGLKGKGLDPKTLVEHETRHVKDGLIMFKEAEREGFTDAVRLKKEVFAYLVNGKSIEEISNQLSRKNGLYDYSSGHASQESRDKDHETQLNFLNSILDILKKHDDQYIDLDLLAPYPVKLWGEILERSKNIKKDLSKEGVVFIKNQTDEQKRKQKQEETADEKLPLLEESIQRGASFGEILKKLKEVIDDDRVIMEKIQPFFEKYFLNRSDVVTLSSEMEEITAYADIFNSFTVNKMTQQIKEEGMASDLDKMFFPIRDFYKNLFRSLIENVDPKIQKIGQQIVDSTKTDGIVTFPDGQELKTLEDKINYAKKLMV